MLNDLTVTQRPRIGNSETPSQNRVFLTARMARQEFFEHVRPSSLLKRSATVDEVAQS